MTLKLSLHCSRLSQTQSIPALAQCSMEDSAAQIDLIIESLQRSQVSRVSRVVYHMVLLS